MNPDWVRDIRDQCLSSDVAFFFKQWGNWIPSLENKPGTTIHLKTTDGKTKSLSMKRLSKKQAGKVIDGKVWNQVPVISTRKAT